MDHLQFLSAATSGQWFVPVRERQGQFQEMLSLI